MATNWQVPNSVWLIDMLQYMDYLSLKYPELVEMLTIGKSSLGQPLKVIKVSTGQRAKSGDIKPAVWIDGGEFNRSPPHSVNIVFCCLNQSRIINMRSYKCDCSVYLLINWFIDLKSVSHISYVQHLTKICVPKHSSHRPIYKVAQRSVSWKLFAYVSFG
jgi:hypothetical protein